EVDVNVHPAKREVRFRDGNGVKGAVVEAVSGAVLGTPAGPFVRGGKEREGKWPEVGLKGGGLSGNPGGAVAIPEAVLIPEHETRVLRRDWAEGGLADRSSDETLEPAEAPSARLSPGAGTGIGTGEATRASVEDFRMLGVLGRLYVLLESAEGMVLMDQHAAHERVLFEEMRRRMETEGVPSQRLLIPLTIEFDPKEFDLVRRNLETLQRLGISAEEFGPNTLKVDSLPTFLKSDEKTAFVNQVVEELKRESARTSSMRLGEDMVATTVCRHAVKANDPLHEEELMQLLEDLLACEMPYCCPHGRPTLIQMTYGELERRFGRRVP
ncbi:MAG: DNA mismatch repair protein MutL, partial [Verrucomicrobiota bacterium]